MPNSSLAFDNIVPIQAEAAVAAPVAAAPVAAAAAAIHTLPGVSSDFEKIGQAWNEMFGTNAIPIPIAKWIQRIINNGIEPALIVRAIEETAWAKKPTPSYFRGILNRCIANGITTVNAYDEHEAERDMMYQQRSKRNGNDWIL